MPKLNPKEIMEEEATNLIKTVTDIEEDEENFEICERFVLSNLFYHKFLDPNENKIDRILKGVHQKFMIHAQPDKAHALQSLVTKYKDSDIWKEHHDQYDIKYRLLSFLLNLSSSPLHVDYIPADSTPNEEEENIDWIALLKEGEESFQPLDSDDELSEWSDEETSELQDLNDSDKHENCISPTDTDLGCITSSFIPETDQISQRLQFPYWNKKQSLVSNNDLLAPNFASEVVKYQRDNGKICSDPCFLSEYQILREICWMLRNPVESPLFEFCEGSFFIRRGLTLGSLTDGALSSVMLDMVTAVNCIYRLKLFLQEDHGLNIPKTVEAYKSGIQIFLENFSKHLFNIENEVFKQNSIHTILSVMDKLKIWLKSIEELTTIHEYAIKDFSINENWYSTVKLLSVLYNALLTNKSHLMPFLLDTFLRCMEPYFNIIQTWLTEGRLEDWNDEFIFYKNKEVSQEEDDFWLKAFKCREYKMRLKNEDIDPIKLFDQLDRKLFVSGKSVEILSTLDHLTDKNMVREAHNTDQRVLFRNFIDNVVRQLPHSETNRHLDVPLDTVNLQDNHKAIVESADDPFLALAFSEAFNSISTKCKSDENELCSTFYSNLLLPSNSVDLLFPIDAVLRRSLSPTITLHYERACSALVELFMCDLELESVLSRARQIFFMEAGDLMHDFCTELFQLLVGPDNMDITDSAALTLLLQDCLSSRFPSWCDQFTCTFSPSLNDITLPSLDGLKIHLHITWPLNIILNQTNLEVYNKIFTFLAGVKRTLWALQSVRLSSLPAIEMRMETDDGFSNDTSKSFDESSLPLHANCHRLQLLRAWLLFFTTTMHGYFMSRVVHFTEIELKESLKNANDLDMIISAHESYLNRIHDQCFLHPKVKMLREAVIMVFKIGLELHHVITNQVSINYRSLIAWEEKYRKCHNFLADTLQAMTARRKLPHLEGLTTALIHSRPA